MNVIKQILATTDLSAPARHALDRSVQIAAQHQAQCHVVHAIELDTLNSLREWMSDEEIADLKRKLEQDASASVNEQLALSRKHQQPSAEVKTDTHVICGPRLAVINHLADTLDIDLLVIGARGQGFLKHRLLGSTASRIIRKSVNHPVLVVKHPPHGAYQKVLIPMDFSVASVRAIQMAMQLAPGAEITLLHAFQVPFEGQIAYAGLDEDVVKQYRISARDKALMNIRDSADAAGLDVGEYTPLIVHGDPSQSVLDQEQQFDIDLIVMGKHGKGFTEELLLGSVTKHVLEESQCDVLVVDGGLVESEMQI